MEITKSTTKFSYRIEPNPGGGFIARPSDPAMGSIEGATREEVQQKTQAKIKEMMGDQLTREFNFAGMNVTVGSKVNIKSRADSGFEGQTSLKSDTLISASTPVLPSDSSGTVLRVIAALVALGLFAWWLLHR